jgi:hypothetical protein
MPNKGLDAGRGSPPAKDQSWVWLLLIVAAGGAACLALNLPGHLSFDSVLQLAQGRSGSYNTWHPPVMAWLLGLGDRLVRGASLFVLLDVLLVFGGLALFATASARPGRLTLALAVLFCASPLLLIYPAIVWKDVLFGAAATCGFGALTTAAARWRAPVARRLWTLLAWGLLVLAALTRQNGLVILPIAAAAFGLVCVAEGQSRRPLRTGLLYACAFFAASVVCVAVASAALNARSDGEPARVHQVEDLQVYDIVGALTLDPGLQLGVLHARAPALERQLRTAGVAAYTPVRIDPLVELPGLVQGRDRNRAVLNGQWRELVTRHPVLYLKTRARLLRWVVLTPELDKCVPVYVGVDGPEPEMSELGLKPRGSDRDAAAEAYGWWFVGGPVLSHAAYGAVALLLLAWFCVRRRRSDYAVAGLLLSAMAFTATFSVLSVACDYRYLYFLDLATMAAALYGAATWRPRSSEAKPRPVRTRAGSGRLS